MAQLAALQHPSSARWSPRPADRDAEGFSITADNHQCPLSITLMLIAEETKHCLAPDAPDVPQHDYNLQTRLDLKKTTSRINYFILGSTWQPEIWSLWQRKAILVKFCGRHGSAGWKSGQRNLVSNTTLFTPAWIDTLRGFCFPAGFRTIKPIHNKHFMNNGDSVCKHPFLFSCSHRSVTHHPHERLCAHP